MPPSAISKRPLRAAIGAGEGALLVAEQLAFQQLGRDGAAVDGDERPLPARAGVVDGAGRELLAGARLAEDQHAGIVRGDLADQARHIANAPASCRSACQRRRLLPASLATGTRSAAAKHRMLERECEAAAAAGRARRSTGRRPRRNRMRRPGHRELLTQCSTELAPVAVGDVADQQGRRSVRRLDHGAHQRAVIDQQRFEAKCHVELPPLFSARSRVAVIDDCAAGVVSVLESAVSFKFISIASRSHAECFCMLGGILSVTTKSLYKALPERPVVRELLPEIWRALKGIG